jgi:hypothetical protein
VRTYADLVHVRVCWRAQDASIAAIVAAAAAAAAAAAVTVAAARANAIARAAAVARAAVARAACALRRPLVGVATCGSGTARGGRGAPASAPPWRLHLAVQCEPLALSSGRS